MLVVDDDGDIRDVMARILEEAGFLVRTASNGLEALIAAYEDVIISRTRDRVRSRPWPSVAPGEVEHGVPLFLTQLSETLRLEARPRVCCHVHRRGRRVRAAALSTGTFSSASSLLTPRCRSTLTRSSSCRP